MKTIHSYQELIGRYYLPIILSLGFISLFTPQLSLYLTSVTYVFLGFLLLFLFSKLGNTQLGGKPRHRLINIAKLFLLQLLIISSFICIAFIFINMIPIPAVREGTHAEQALTLIANNVILRWGLFPWTVYALVAASVCYHQHKFTKPVSLLNIMRPFTRKQTDAAVGMGADLFIRQGLVFFLGTLLGIISLAVYVIMTHHFHLPISAGPTLSALLVVVISYIIVINSKWQTLIRWFWVRNLTISQLALLQALSLAVLLVVLNPLAIYLVQSTSTPIFGFLIRWLNLDAWAIPWQITILAIALSATPIIAALMAPLLTGLTIRSALVGSMCLPTLLSIAWFFYYFNYTGFNHLNDTISMPTAMAYLFLAIIGLITIILFCARNKIIQQQLLLVTYRAEQLAKKQKNRYPLQISQGILRTMAVLTFLYLLFGLKALGVFYFAIVATCCVAYTLTNLGMIYLLSRLT